MFCSLFLKTEVVQASPFGDEFHYLILNRLSEMSETSEIPFSYNNEVQKQLINYYKNDPKFIPVALARARRHFPEIEKNLERYGLPNELKYLPVLESLLNPTAESRAGAVGIWQLMTSTAGDFNLRMDGYTDDRENVRLSSRAACRFIKRLYKIYGDWFLVMAAYNNGPGNINKALARQPGATTFWEIEHNLPKETRQYIPKFIAIAYLMEYADEYGLHRLKKLKPQAPKKPQYKTVKIEKETSLERLSEEYAISLSAIRKLNPSFATSVARVPFSIKLPRYARRKEREIAEPEEAVQMASEGDEGNQTQFAAVKSIFKGFELEPMQPRRNKKMDRKDVDGVFIRNRDEVSASV